jgi:FkbM family methyltransferase
MYTLVSFYLKLICIDLPMLATRVRRGGMISVIELYGRFVWFVCSRKTFLRGVPYKFLLSYNNVPFELSLRYPVDIAPLVELYVDREYEHTKLHDPKIIIDLGANYGDSAIFLHTLYPCAQIYALEPAPQSFTQLEKNAAQFKEIIPVNALVSDTTGAVQFYLNTTGALGNSLTARGAVEAISVASYTLADLYTHLNIEHADLIKFDIEGAEAQVFAHSNPARFASHYMGEVHEDLMPVPLETFLSYFAEFTCTKRPLKNPKRCILWASHI